MVLTASYNNASVAGCGDLKYSSRASNNKGYLYVSVISRDVMISTDLIYM
jgi:hypothetical protein